MVAEKENENTLAIVSSEGAFRKITIEELNKLGYELTGRQKPMGSMPYKYGILEIKNEDDKQELSFCYLYSLENQTGVILNRHYSYYVNQKN